MSLWCSHRPLLKLGYPIYLNNIGVNITVDMLEYAGDFVLYTSRQDLDIVLVIQENLDKLIHNFDTIGLPLSATKSEAMFFRNKKIITNTLHGVEINGSRVEVVQSFNFFGFVLQHNLNYGQHVRIIKESCFQFTNILRSLCMVQTLSAC